MDARARAAAGGWSVAPRWPMPRTLMVAVLLVASAGCAARAPRGSGLGPEDAVAAPVGYGEQARRDGTGAVGTVEPDDLAGQQAARVEELFRARVPGVDVRQLPNGEFTV